MLGVTVFWNVPGWMTMPTDGAEADVYPDFEAVTRTLIVFPTSPATGLYPALVAPAIDTPSRSHW